VSRHPKPVLVDFSRGESMLAQRGPVWAFTMATANGHSRATSVARALAWTGPSGGWCSRSLPVVATQVTHPRSAARNLDRLEHNPALDSEVLNHHPSLESRPRSVAQSLAAPHCRPLWPLSRMASTSTRSTTPASCAPKASRAAEERVHPVATSLIGNARLRCSPAASGSFRRHWNRATPAAKASATIGGQILATFLPQICAPRRCSPLGDQIRAPAWDFQKLWLRTSRNGALRERNKAS